MSVEGLPGWLTPAVLRSLEAVWREIPTGMDVDREGTLALVADRLFAGYDIDVSLSCGKPLVRFSTTERVLWDVSLSPPELGEAPAEWFAADTPGVVSEVAALLEPLPQDALTWADEALRKEIAGIIEARMPGWDFSAQISLAHSRGALTLSLRPRPPLVLAITPSLYSGTIPIMFRSDLEAKLLAAFSPLTGLPVAWVNHHRKDVEKLAREFLEDRNSVENMRARVEVNFHPAPVSRLDARVDSDRFLFQVWIAAYAGLSDRYPEAGVFFGWNTAHLTGVDLELYGESVLELEDFEFAHRLGFFVQLFGDFRAGLEMQWPESEWFCRVQWGASRIRRPYLRWRWSPELGHEGALGYRVDEHISVEIYYDGTGSDKVGLRGIWSL